jgi:hypothetical protein
MDAKIESWLLEGDPAIRWQVLQDLLEADEAVVAAERARVAQEGWGARLLTEQAPSGHFGGGLYSPKWISTTYSMLLLRRLGLPPDNPAVQKSCRLLLDTGLCPDGGANYAKSRTHGEACVTGMALSILSYFGFEDERLRELVDYLLEQQMADGGWNCETYQGATHGSFHTTINVLEGLREYEKWQGEEASMGEAQARAREFLLQHRLFRSHRTGEVVDVRMTRFSFPPRWYYDVLRALDYFCDVAAPYDERLEDALELVRRKRRRDGTWPLQNRHPGRTFFEMEKPGRPSRWNTLRSLRILQWADDVTREERA